jgi:tRNA-dihydrouridine synthase A
MPLETTEAPSVRVKNGVHRVQIAPMLDVSNAMFRYVFMTVRSYVPRNFMRLLTKRSQIWTEMVVDQILTHNENDDRVLHEHLEFQANEEPIVLQLGGSNPSILARAVRIAYNFGYVQEINLNAGCPSCRVAGKGEFGAALMKKPDVIRACLEAMALAAPVSVSLKTRLGVDDLDSKEFFDTYVDQLLSTNLPATSNFSLVVHARKAWLNGLSPAQNRTIPPLDYQRAFDICGSKSNLRWYLNGGINSLEEAASLLAKAPSNMEGVMMGRAAMNTPTIFANTDVLLYGEDTNPVSAQTRRSVLEAYSDYLHDRFPIEPDIKLKPGTIHLAIKPILGILYGHRGNRQWRNNLDRLCRDESLRNEVGPGGIILEAMKDVDWDILDAKLVSE